MRLKARWTVTAGLYPGHVIEEFTRTWEYLSEDYDADRKTPYATNFMELVKTAGLYAMTITDPSKVNYVKTEFMWL